MFFFLCMQKCQLAPLESCLAPQGSRNMASQEAKLDLRSEVFVGSMLFRSFVEAASARQVFSKPPQSSLHSLLPSGGRPLSMFLLERRRHQCATSRSSQRKCSACTYCCFETVSCMSDADTNGGWPLQFLLDQTSVFPPKMHLLLPPQFWQFFYW